MAGVIPLTVGVILHTAGVIPTMAGVIPMIMATTDMGTILLTGEDITTDGTMDIITEAEVIIILHLMPTTAITDGVLPIPTATGNPVPDTVPTGLAT